MEEVLIYILSLEPYMYVYSAIIVAAEALCMEYACNVTLEKRFSNRFFGFFFLFLGGYTISFLGPMLFFIYKPLVLILFFSLASALVYMGTFLTKLFVITYQYAILFSVQALVATLSDIIIGSHMASDLYEAVIAFFSSFIALIVAYYVAQKLYKKIGYQFSIKQPVYVLIPIYITISAVVYTHASGMSYLTFFLAASIFFELFTIYKYVYSTSVLSISDHKAQMLAQQFDQQKAHSREIEEVLKRQRMFEHDNKAQWDVQAHLLNKSEVEKATSHANTRAGEAGLLRLEHITGNTSLDTILGVKQAEAENNGVDFAVKHNSLLNCTIPDDEISSLLSNMLNNAFEATLQCPQEKRVVQVNLEMNREEFCMAVRNSHCNSIMLQSGEFISSKDKSEHHGLGLRIIRSILEKYGEEPYFDYDDQWFQISLSIPISKSGGER